MNTGKYDESALKALSPRDVAGWLRMRGFAHRGPYGEFGDIFERTVDGEAQELILPTFPQSRDFGRRMSELVSDLSDYVDQSPGDLLTDLTMAPFDVVKVRSSDADDYGSVRLAAGIDLHGEAWNLVLAAANAAASPLPRRSWRGRRFDEVTSYLENVRLGQSQRGSFILTVLSPWDFVPGNQPSLDLADITFGRRVTRSLAAALNATEVAIRQSVAAGTRPLLEAYRSGVSSNFCLALAKLAREGEGIDVSINWSPAQPESKDVSIQLKREDSSILTEAAKELSRQEAEPDFTVEGVITGISEPADRFSGSVVLETILAGVVRKVRINFGAEDRKTIFEAAQAKRWVRVVGELSREGQRLSLANPRDIALIEAEEAGADP
jgi:hypothetical protein